MFEFLKKLFGFGKKGDDIKPIEAPYKVEVDITKGNSAYYDSPEWLRDGDPKTMGEETPAPEVKKPEPVVNKKPRGPRKPQGQKTPAAKPQAPKAPAAKPQAPTQGARRGRKPKTK